MNAYIKRHNILIDLFTENYHQIGSYVQARVNYDFESNAYENGIEQTIKLIAMLRLFDLKAILHD